jgi:hypothetical protein
VALLGSILVTIVVAGGVLLLARGNHATYPTATTVSPPHHETSQQLIRILGTLRRPQTALDRKILRQSGLDRSSDMLFLGGASQTATSASPGPVAHSPADPQLSAHTPSSPTV